MFLKMFDFLFVSLDEITYFCRRNLRNKIIG